jgi:serine/threonine-protein phosphatase 4 catalytic subunit
MQKYGTLNIWRYCVEVFDYLPLSCLVDNNYLCMHGGLSPNISTIDDIRIIDRK